MHERLLLFRCGPQTLHKYSIPQRRVIVTEQIPFWQDKRARQAEKLYHLTGLHPVSRTRKTRFFSSHCFRLCFAGGVSQRQTGSHSLFDETESIARTQLHSPITTIPGMGFRMVAMILAEVGDFSRVDSPNKLLAYAGMLPLPTSQACSEIVTHTWKNAVRDICAIPFTIQPNTSTSGTRPSPLISPRNGRRASITTSPFSMPLRSWFGSYLPCKNLERLIS